eukprot:m.254257 g.254257  ORF g.254257 m.254257 type:complete len:77 (+) comp71628_c0_seq1:228-458(+)
MNTCFTTNDDGAIVRPSAAPYSVPISHPSPQPLLVFSNLHSEQHRGRREQIAFDTLYSPTRYPALCMRAVASHHDG